MNVRGKIIRTKVAPGSKSERDAVVIVTGDREFVLRRSGANPFVDPELDKLVGKHLQCEGTLHGQHFIMTDWSEVDEE
ncbi:MAG: hypothetical protein HQ581_09655 [Planctomycetes bacterium]|nr:hypothetical protein [Planctomycetota bacterium]